MWGYTAVVCLLFSSWLFLYSPLRGIVFGAHQTQGPVVAPFIKRPKEEGSVSSPSFADGGDVAFRRGTHDAVPLKCRSCDSSWDWGRFGRWVYDANNRSSRWNPHWVEPCCDAEWLFRPWSTERFCREALRCGDLLFVGDSTMWQMFASVKFFLNHDGEKGATCARFCRRGIRVVFRRHDYLNGPRYFGRDASSMDDSWREPSFLTKFAWVVLSTGTHVGDHPDLQANKDGIWQRRTRELFHFLNDTLRPEQRVVWRTSWWGMAPMGNPGLCPDPSFHGKFIRREPVPRHNISTMFRGSWRRILDYNVMAEEELRKFRWRPTAAPVFWDVGQMMAMRADCRADWIHFNRTSDYSPLRLLPIYLSALMVERLAHPLSGGAIN
eukprot:COSAG01_NODE_12069_length_1805_cov_2.198710_1_plen_381_part_00